MAKRSGGSGFGVGVLDGGTDEIKNDEDDDGDGCCCCGGVGWLVGWLVGCCIHDLNVYMFRVTGLT